MKITKSRLKQIIMEELKRLNENDGDSIAMQAALQEDEEGAEAEEHLRARYAELSAKAYSTWCSEGKIGVC